MGSHQGQPVLSTGADLEGASAAMILIHGRGATAQDILTLTPELGQPGWTFLAPQAAGGAWYPDTFRAPIERNEPWLSSALQVVGDLLAVVGRAGIPAERTILLGFSQGACLALEYAARNARRYGGLVGLSGSLIGPDDAPRRDSGSLAGTPTFLGCSDRDPHIPAARVIAAAAALEALGGAVTMVLYPDHDHSVNQDEIEQVLALMRL